jgi:hypothetical protein
MTDGFITSIKKILLEDAGLSGDPVPANNIGSGNIAGTPPDSPPGAAHRRRKRLMSRRDRNLHKALTAENGVVELDLLSYAGQHRFDEGKDGVIDTKPEISLSGNEVDPNPKKSKKLPSKLSLRRGPDAEILIDPIVATRFEDVVAESHKRPKRPTQRCDFLVKMGLGDIEHLTWYRNALQDPFICVNSAQYRPVVAEVLDQLLDLIFADPVLYNRLRMQLLQNREREQSEDTDELERFARWKASKVENELPEDIISDTWKKVKGGADRRRPPGISDEDWDRHLLAKHTGTVHDKIKKFRVGGNR